MSAYDAPWERGGIREDGYWVLDPRDYRNTPGDTAAVSPWALLSERLKAAGGSAQTKREAEQIQKMQPKTMEELWRSLLP